MNNFERPAVETLNTRLMPLPVSALPPKIAPGPPRSGSLVAIRQEATERFRQLIDKLTDAVLQLIADKDPSRPSLRRIMGQSNPDPQAI